MAEITDLRAISEIAQGYVAFSDQFLSENLGRPYNIQELAQFSETAGAAILASAYANFREHLGKEAAQAWLEKTLSVAAATVRLMGADALLKFEVHIKDMPNKLHQRAEKPTPPSEPVPQAASAQAPNCSCTIAADGSCATCIPVLADVLKGTFKFMRHMMESGKKAQALCRICQGSQTDRALATVVPDAIGLEGPHGKATNEEISAIFHQMAGQVPIPLTDKALKEALKAS